MISHEKVQPPNEPVKVETYPRTGRLVLWALQGLTHVGTKLFERLSSDERRRLQETSPFCALQIMSGDGILRLTLPTNDLAKPEAELDRATLKLITPKLKQAGSGPVRLQVSSVGDGFFLRPGKGTSLNPELSQEAVAGFLGILSHADKVDLLFQKPDQSGKPKWQCLNSSTLKALTIGSFLPEKYLQPIADLKLFEQGISAALREPVALQRTDNQAGLAIKLKAGQEEREILASGPWPPEKAGWNETINWQFSSSAGELVLKFGPAQWLKQISALLPAGRKWEYWGNVELMVQRLTLISGEGFDVPLLKVDRSNYKVERPHELEISTRGFLSIPREVGFIVDPEAGTLIPPYEIAGIGRPDDFSRGATRVIEDQAGHLSFTNLDGERIKIVASRKRNGQRETVFTVNGLGVSDLQPLTFLRRVLTDPASLENMIRFGGR